MRSALLATLALATAMSAPPAQATVDVFLDVNVPYRHLQTNDLCFMKTKMWAVVGIPAGSAMNGTFKPVYVFQDQNAAAFPYVNINVLATTPALGASYVNDAYAGSVLEYRMKLDLTKYSAAQGTTVAGRTRTVAAAKLAIIAMARNLATLNPAGFRLWLQLVGLPSQTGLAGTPVYATTTSPYTATSPLLAAYTRELVNVGGSCR